MPKIKVNPEAKRPEFVAVVPGEYSMRFERLTDKFVGQSEKGNWWTRMRLVHVEPPTALTSLTTGQPLTAEEIPGSVSALFMMDHGNQGTLRQAIEASGQVWPSDGEIDENWIMDSLDGREVVVRLKTRQYKDEWQNEVARYITER